MEAVQKDILAKIYGFDPTDVKKQNNGSWDMEQYTDKDMTYTARILPNRKIHITVETKDIFPKVVSEYEYKQD